MTLIFTYDLQKVKMNQLSTSLGRGLFMSQQAASNYPFCCVHRSRNSQWFSVGQATPKKFFPWGDLNPIWYMIPWAHMSQPPNGISIGAAVFAQYISAINTQTCRSRYVWHVSQQAVSLLPVWCGLKP